MDTKDLLKEVLIRSLEVSPFDNLCTKIMHDDQFWIKKIEYHCGVTILDFRGCNCSLNLPKVPMDDCRIHESHCCSHNGVSKESIFNWFFEHSKNIEDSISIYPKIIHSDEEFPGSIYPPGTFNDDIPPRTKPEDRYSIYPEYLNLIPSNLTSNQLILLKYSGYLIQDINKIFNRRDFVREVNAIQREVRKLNDSSPPSTLFNYPTIKLNNADKLYLNIFKIICTSLAPTEFPITTTKPVALNSAYMFTEKLLNPTHWNFYALIIQESKNLDIKGDGITKEDVLRTYTDITNLIYY